MACECCGNYPCDELGDGEGEGVVTEDNCEQPPEDCCDCAAGDWSESTSYPQGILISHQITAVDFLGNNIQAEDDNGQPVVDNNGNPVFETEEVCFKALKETCAPNENPEPGMPIAQGYWERCTPICTYPGSYFDITSGMCDYLSLIHI